MVLCKWPNDKIFIFSIHVYVMYIKIFMLCKFQIICIVITIKFSKIKMVWFRIVTESHYAVRFK